MSYTRDAGLTAILAKSTDPIEDPGEERKLLRRAQREDAAAMDRLIRANVRGVVYIARPWRGFVANSSLEFVDLVQEGLIGLREAILRFDLQRANVRLFSYAVHWIRLYIARAVFAAMSPVRLGAAVRTRRLYERIPAVLHEFAERGIASPSNEMIAAKCGCTVSTVSAFRMWLGARTHLDAIDERGTALVVDAPALDEALAEEDLAGRRAAAVRDVLDGLSPRDRDYVESRLAADRGDAEFDTLQDLGDRYEHSREWARQVETRIKCTVRRGLQVRFRQHGLTETGDPR